MKFRWVKVFLSLVVATLFLMPMFLYANAAPSIFRKNLFLNEKTEILNDDANLTGDLKIRTSGGSWQDNSLTADVGTTLEFKIDSSANRDYTLFTVVIGLPIINEEPMFDYIELSAGPIPGPLKGFFEASDTDVIWVWYMIETSWSEEMTFKAKIKKPGTGTVNLYVVGIIDLDEGFYDDVTDAVQVTGEGDPCCFPAGTKITMVDGSYKNIEDVKIGDRVLSYDVKYDRFTSWRVKMLGDPIHPVYKINDGLIYATVDHPFYIKKQDGKTGWGAIDASKAKKAITFRGNVLTLEKGDKLFTSEGKWIEVASITFDPEPVQTYNILSFSGKRTYFANDVLVYEEHPPFVWLKYYWEKLLDIMSVR